MVVGFGGFEAMRCAGYRARACDEPVRVPSHLKLFGHIEK